MVTVAGCATMEPVGGDAMKLAQVVDGSSSAAAIQEGGGFRLIPGHTVESLLEAAQEEGRPVGGLRRAACR